MRAINIALNFHKNMVYIVNIIAVVNTLLAMKEYMAKNKIKYKTKNSDAYFE